MAFCMIYDKLNITAEKEKIKQAITILKSTKSTIFVGLKTKQPILCLTTLTKQAKLCQ